MAELVLAVEVDDADENSEDDESESMTSNNFRASGVAKRLRDFWQNRRADGRFPAFLCFCAIERHFRASSLLLSIMWGRYSTLGKPSECAERVTGMNKMKGRVEMVKLRLVVVGADGKDVDDHLRAPPPSPSSAFPFLPRLLSSCPV